MGIQVYLLALTAFIAAIDENIFIGILPVVAQDLQVSVGAAGQLTSIFSITFALTAPLLLALTARIERRILISFAIAIFGLSNLLAALSGSYLQLFLARMFMAMSCALICLLATTIATRIVAPTHKGRAIGIVFMGISGSLVLGIPVGLQVCDIWGWRAIFYALAALSVPVLVAINMLLPKLAPAAAIPMLSYWRHIRQSKMLSGQMISILMIGGHFTLFAYLTPYAQAKLGITLASISLLFMLFGIAGVIGAYLGGWASDRVGATQAVILSPSLYLLTMSTLLFTSGSVFLFIPFMMLWACLSWTITPAVQNYLIQSDRKNADVSVSLNLSAMHVGVALGTAVGGFVVSYGSLDATPWVGCGIVLLAIAAAIFSTRSGGVAIDSSTQTDAA